MTFVIGAACIDVMDLGCVQECPVDCIYQGNRKVYINPDECIDCGACEPACPVEAIVNDRALTEHDAAFLEDSAAFFSDVLAGRGAPLGSPGGARHLGRIHADSPLVTLTTTEERTS